MISSDQTFRIERYRDYFIEKRLKANLKRVQPGDELGIRRAKRQSETQGVQWFEMVTTTARRTVMAKATYTIADSPGDPIYNGGFDHVGLAIVQPSKEYHFT